MGSTAMIAGIPLRVVACLVVAAASLALATVIVVKAWRQAK